MHFQRIIPPLGLLLVVLAGAMLLPAMVDLASGNSDWQVFLASAFFTGGVGAYLYLGFRGASARRWSRRDGFVFVAVSWFVVAVAAALPFHFSTAPISGIGAFFESVSGLTTTGATVLGGLDTMPPGILLWRSLLHWIGGVGIVVLSVFLFPFLKLGGQHLFALESSDTAEKSFARFEEYALRILFAYVLLTALCTFGYDVLGMTFFEAINHAMATVSTGGFSTSDLSIGKFNSLAIVWWAILFMFIGGLPFMVVLFMFSPRRKFDVQILYFLGIIAVAVALILVALELRGDILDFSTFSSVAFTVTAIITTTGFVFRDYGGWPTAALLVIFLITVLGACSGSTAGGLKVFRIVILVQMCRAAIGRVLWPNAVRSMKYGERPFDEDVGLAVVAFGVLYVATLIAGAILLSLSGHDLITAVSASATALANVGPGLGPVVGPAFNFAALSDFDLAILSLQMLLGRLEIMSIVVLLAPALWRD